MKLLYSLIFFFISVVVTAQSLVLVNDGKSAYKIIVSAKADSIEIRAAGILQNYLQKISGVKLPIFTDKKLDTRFELVIGKTNRAIQNKFVATLNPDGYYLKTNGQKLMIEGGSGKGTIYGVVSFLEDYLGCRKYAPDAEQIPTLKKIVIGQINDRQQPPSTFRIVNGTFSNDEDYKDWRKLSTVADIWGDGNWKGYFVHTFTRFLPPQQYFSSHPEYFSLLNGKRVPYAQLCLTNDSVFKIVVNKLMEEMAVHPNVKYWSVSQNDTYNNCQCENCKRLDSLDGGPTGSLLHFVNKVADLFPDKIITTLAYQYSRKPPLHTKPAPNVMITLCTIELNRSLPIETDPSSVSFKNDIIGWSKLTKNIMIWDYEVQFTNYLCPFPLFHTLQPNIQFFTNYGTIGHFQQCNGSHGVEFAELKSYLLSKILWDPNANADAIIHDFMNGYYKQASPYVLEYFNLLHQLARESKQGLDIYGTPVWNENTFLSAKNIQRYYKIFDSAEAAVANDLEILERVKIAKLSVQYADMEIAKTDMFGPRGWYTIEDGKYILKPERKHLLEDFYATCKKNNIKNLNEKELTAEIYYHNTRRFIDVQVEGNLAFQKPVTCSPMPNKNYTAMGTATLTNGVKGTDDYKINWLGWEGQDITITLDLLKDTAVNEITISSLQFPKSWILHPLQISCMVSSDGVTFIKLGTIASNKDLQTESLIRNFSFNANGSHSRYIKFLVTGTKVLPAWHDYVGNPSWVFLDEIVIK